MIVIVTLNQILAVVRFCKPYRLSNSEAVADEW